MKYAGQYTAPRYLVETYEDLEEVVRVLAGATTGFLDVETTSGDKEKKSLNPHRDCSLAGIAITVEGDRPAYYIPVGHEVTLFSKHNLDKRIVLEALKRITCTWRLWVNQNVKYDLHAIYNDVGWIPDCAVECLLTLAKVQNTDKMQYDLTALSNEFRGVDISPLEDALKPYKVDNQDYGRIPVDVMAPYAAEDVIAVREIWESICKSLPAELDTVRKMERAVTLALFNAEQEGLTIDPHKLKVQQYTTGLEITMRLDALTEKVGYPGFTPSSPKCMNELFCNRLGLPVLKWTNEDDDEKPSNPSFGKEALAEYLVHPKAPIAVVSEVIRIRKLDKFYSGFLKPYASHHVNGKIHASYTQLIRTGRMACKQPNTQQLDAVAKSLIEPKPGQAFLSVDQSQIEFRGIAHFIRDARALKAYNENPDTDFHQWVADLAHIARKPAKTVNFLMGYGGGKETLIKALMKDPDLVGSIKAEVDIMAANGANYEACEKYFKEKARKLAEGIYDTYHRTLPNLKRTTYQATEAALGQGYIKNLYKRRRHLTKERAHIAFNSACQGTAADFIKEALIRLAPMCASYGVSIVAIVHDEILFQGPIEVIESEGFLREVLAIMEKPEPLVPFTVPVRCSYGTSRESWLKASKVEAKYPLERSDWHKRGKS
jgi:DNA polymerase I-like protein with 3'-5' exonuclease and polymerase domains